MELHHIPNMTDTAYRDMLYEAKPEAFASNYDTDFFPGLSYPKMLIYNTYQIRKTLQEYQEEHRPECWLFTYTRTADLYRVAVVSKPGYLSITVVVALQLLPYSGVVAEATCGTCMLYHDRMQLRDSAVNDVEVAMFLDPFFAFLKEQQQVPDRMLAF